MLDLLLNNILFFFGPIQKLFGIKNEENIRDLEYVLRCIYQSTNFMAGLILSNCEVNVLHKVHIVQWCTEALMLLENVYEGLNAQKCV